MAIEQPHSTFMRELLAKGPIDKPTLIRETARKVHPETAAKWKNDYVPPSLDNRMKIWKRQLAIAHESLHTLLKDGRAIEVQGKIWSITFAPGSRDRSRKIDLIPIELIQSNRKNDLRTNDVKSLAESIQCVGLLHPVSLVEKATSEGRELHLAAGGRRLEAYRLLKETLIPARISSPPDDIPFEVWLRLIEAVENVERLPYAEVSEQEARRLIGQQIALAQKRRDERARANGQARRMGGHAIIKGSALPPGSVSHSVTNASQDNSARSLRQAARITGMSLRQAAPRVSEEQQALKELKLLASSKPRESDPGWWRPDCLIATTAQGQIFKIEQKEISPTEALEQMKESIENDIKLAGNQYQKSNQKSDQESEVRVREDVLDEGAPEIPVAELAEVATVAKEVEEKAKKPSPKTEETPKEKPAVQAPKPHEVQCPRCHGKGTITVLK